MIDMKGYKVLYGNYAYKCLAVDPIMDSSDGREGTLERPAYLEVHLIDHDGFYAVIRNYANQFVFVKDVFGI